MPRLGYVRDFSLEKALRDFGNSFVVLFDDNDVGAVGSDPLLLRRCCIGEIEFNCAKVGERYNRTIVVREIFDDPLGVPPTKWMRRADVYLRNFTSGEVLDLGYPSCSGSGLDRGLNVVTRIDF